MVVGIEDQPFLILVAARDIVAGEEMEFDYGDRSKEGMQAHPFLRHKHQWLHVRQFIGQLCYHHIRPSDALLWLADSNQQKTISSK